MNKNKNQSTEKWVRVATAAKLREVSRQTVYYWIEKGMVKHKQYDTVDFVYAPDVESIKISRRSEVKKRLHQERKANNNNGSTDL